MSKNFNSDGTINYDYNYYSDSADTSPQIIEGDYSVTDFENDPDVIRAYESVTNYLASKRGIGSALLDPAGIGRGDSKAEGMRDDEFRIGSRLIKASILEDSPEEIKANYRLMKDRWQKSSLSGIGETLTAVKDYGIDAIFNPETIGTVAAALFSRGTSLPADIARRKAGKEALDKAIESSSAAITKNPLAYSAGIGATYGGVDNLSLQKLEIAVNENGKTDYSAAEALGTAGVGALAGVGIYGATKLGAKYFSKGTDIGDEIPPNSELFDEADLPESAKKLVEDIDNITVDPNKVYQAGIYNPARTQELLDQVDELNVDKLVEDLGGSEKTKNEILDAIRLAVSQETTAQGIQNKTKQALYKTYADLSGNWFGKSAGILSPYSGLSATARILQTKLSYEFGTGVKDYSSKVVEKDLGEVQRQVTGGYSERFRAIVEGISLNTAKGDLAQDVNDLLMVALRSNKSVTFKNIDDQTATKINDAAKATRKLYEDMGKSLQEIGVIDELVDNYIPRMWDRKAIEANPQKLAQLLESKGGYVEGTGMQTVQDMLDIKDQIDSGGAGGHFFSAKRKLNQIENDTDFQEFLNGDVLGSLNMYTFQAGKSIAKHRVLGVNNLAEFQKVWTSKIQAELSAKGEKLTEGDIKQIDLLYKTATSEGLERYGKKTQNAVDTYGFVNRVGMLGLATLSSLTEVFINFSKAGVVNSVKGFGEALEISYKGITGDLTDQLQTKHGLTAKEAFSELRKTSMAMDQAMAQQGNRLAGDDLVNETLQNASNKFFKLTLLDQWTRFVQTTSYASGKNLINENIEALAANGGRLSNKRLKTLAGELRELSIDPDEAVEWFNKGAKKDGFYDDQILGGAARYANSVVLQPTAMSGLKPLLHSNPKTSIAFQLLGYPVAFTNTVLKGAAKAMIKDPTRNVPKTFAAGFIMTEMARWTNYARSDGKSEKDKTLPEIYRDAITRWGGNGILLDSLQRARESSMYSKNTAPYLMLPFGPIGSDLQKFYQQGIIPTIGGKVPFLSGSYMGSKILGEYPVADFKQALRDMQKKYIRDPLVKDADTFQSGFKKGGEVIIPNAPLEPDERIDKVTGQPYNQQAGSAFMDETDPLKVMMNSGGFPGAPRQKYVIGGTVKVATKLVSPLAERISNKVENLFNPETINVAAANVEKQIIDADIDPNTQYLDDYVDALIDDSLEPDNFRTLAELREIPAWRKFIENKDKSKQLELSREAQTALGISERKLTALDTIQKLSKDIDPVRGLQSVMPNSLGNLTTEYQRLRYPSAANSGKQNTGADIESDDIIEEVLSLSLEEIIKKYSKNNATDKESKEAADALRKVFKGSDDDMPDLLDDPEIEEYIKLEVKVLLEEKHDLNQKQMEEQVSEFFSESGQLRMGEDFSRARGYTKDEIKTFNTASEYLEGEDMMDVISEIQYVLDERKLTQKTGADNKQQALYDSVGASMERERYSKGGLYKILIGDTLSAIAKNNNTSVAKLASLNKIQDPDKIYEGQSIVLPTTAEEVQKEQEQQQRPQQQQAAVVKEKPRTPLSEQVEKVYTGATNTLTDKANAASSFVSDVSAKVKGSLNDLPTYNAPEQSTLSLTPAMETYQSPDIGSQANAALEQTKEALSTFGQGVKSSISVGADNVTGVASDLSDQTKEVLQDTAQNTSDSVVDFRNQTQQNLENAASVRENLETKQREAVTQSTENISNLATAASDQVSETFSSVKESTGKGVTALRSLLTSGVDAVKDFELPEPNKIKSFADPKVVELDLPVEAFKPAGKKETLTSQETEDQNQLIGTLKGFYEASGTQVAKNLLSFFNPFAGDKTEKDYTPESVDALRFAARDALSKGQETIDYKNYNLEESNVRAQVGSGAQRRRDKLQERMFKGDITPTEEAAFSVGGGTLVIEDGNVFVTDKYDFSKLKRQIGAALPDDYAMLRNWISSYSGNEFKSKILVGTLKEMTGRRG